jgi:PAS domain S-box-containing protein
MTKKFPRLKGRGNFKKASQQEQLKKRHKNISSDKNTPFPIKPTAEQQPVEIPPPQSEYNFRSTFEQAQVGIAHISMDGRFPLVNQKFCDIVGYTHEELSHLAYRDITISADREHAITLGQGLIQGTISSVTKEGHYLHKNGSLIWVNQTASLIRDATGKPQFFLIVTEDITERKRSEQRTRDILTTLLTMAELLVLLPDESSTNEIPLDPPEEGVARQLAVLTCQILDCRSVGLLTLEPQTGVLLPLAVAGISTEHKQNWWTTQLQQRYAFSESFSPGQIAQLQNNEVFFLKTEQPALHSLLAPHPTRMMLVAPMILNNQLIGLLVLDHGDTEYDYPEDDLALAQTVARLAALIIERKRLQNEHAVAQASALAQRTANQRMEEFLSIASHELKSPLTTINIYMQVADRLLKGLTLRNGSNANDFADKKEAIQEMLYNAMRQISMLNRLVNDLIDISRIQANKLELHMRVRPCDLTAIVQEVIQNQRHINPARSIHLSMKGSQQRSAANLPVPIGKEETLLPLYADPDRIGQVMTNYIINALKYSPADQAVEVRLQAEDGKAQVSVRDYGPGLSDEEQKYVWERFRQIERIETQSDTGAGLGLGLYISRSIIERHNGEVGVKSTPGEGSTFWFTLPLAPIDAQNLTNLHEARE